MEYALHLLVFTSLYTIAAIGVNLIVGYCGLLTVAHAAYFAIGGYAYALLAHSLNSHRGLALLAAVVLSALLGSAFGVLSLFVDRHMLLLVSLVLQVAAATTASNWYSAGRAVGSIWNLTNGPFGITSIPKPTFFGVHFQSTERFALLATATLLLVYIFDRRLLLSPWGKVVVAIRDDEQVTRSLGKRVGLVRVQAFALASAYIGLAGALFASYLSYIGPTTATIEESFLLLAMVLVGGAGSRYGPLLGAGILIALPELLRLLQIQSSYAPSARLLFYGVAIVVVAHLRPRGVAADDSIQST